MTDFAVVDAGEASELVAMMDATDAWPAVRAAREWVLEQVAPDGDSVVVDAGCGPGTFGASVAHAAVDVDRSETMLHETRRRRSGARIVLGDVVHLPVRDGAARLVRVERVLQWVPDPAAALDELWRITAPGGWMAVTDTDWGTFRVDHPDPAAGARLADSALTWVPHARLARDLPDVLHALGPHELRTRDDTVTITAWDPDDRAQHDGPPGLPLHSITGAHAPDLDPVAARARAGTFRAEVTLVTCVAQRGDA